MAIAIARDDPNTWLSHRAGTAIFAAEVHRKEVIKLKCAIARFVSTEKMTIEEAFYVTKYAHDLLGVRNGEDIWNIVEEYKNMDEKDVK